MVHEKDPYRDDDKMKGDTGDKGVEKGGGKLEVRKSGVGGRMRAGAEMKEMREAVAAGNSQDDLEGSRTLDDDNITDDTGVDPADGNESDNALSPSRAAQAEEDEEDYGRTNRVKGREDETTMLAQMQALIKRRKVNEVKCMVKEKQANTNLEEMDKVREYGQEKETEDFLKEIEKEKEKRDDTEREIEGNEALHLKTLAEEKYTLNNLDSAFNLAQRASKLYPSLDGLPELLAALRILTTATTPVFPNSTIPDYYRILDVERFTSTSTIKKQYRKLALTLHPDKSPFSASEDAFKFLAEAMGVLSDKSKRKEYDTKLRVVMQDQVVVSAGVVCEEEVFRALCSSCGAFHEFERKYFGHDLVCGSCRKSFKAVEVDEGCENGGSVEVEGMSIRVSARIQAKAERSLRIGILDKFGKGVNMVKHSRSKGVEVVGNGESGSGGVTIYRRKKKAMHVDGSGDSGSCESDLANEVNMKRDEGAEEGRHGRVCQERRKIERTKRGKSMEEETMTLAQMQALAKRRKVNEVKCIVKEKQVDNNLEKMDKVREDVWEKETGDCAEVIGKEREVMDDIEREIEDEEKEYENEVLSVSMKKNRLRVSKNRRLKVAKRKLRNVVDLDTERPRTFQNNDLDGVLVAVDREVELEQLVGENSEEKDKVREEDEKAGDCTEEIENAKENGVEDELLIVNKKHQLKVSKNKSSKVAKRKLRSVVDLVSERPKVPQMDDLDVVLVEDREMELESLEENVDERELTIEMGNVMEKTGDMERDVGSKENKLEEDEAVIKKNHLRVSKNRSSKVAKRKLKNVHDLDTERSKASEKDDLDVLLVEDSEMEPETLDENEESHTDIELVNARKKRDRLTLQSRKRRASKNNNSEILPVEKEIEKTLVKTREKRKRQRFSKYSSLEYLKDRIPDNDSDSETEKLKLLKKGNLEIMPVEDSDFHDFYKDRRERSFKKGQVWAVYDDRDGMPRHYALVDRVVSVNPFVVTLSWVEFQSNGDDDLISREKLGFHASCGRFIVTRTVSVKYLNLFSHVVDCERAAREAYKIYPRKGSVWALYTNNNLNGEGSNGKIKDNECDSIVVSLTSYSDIYGLSIGFLEKVDGFRTVFKRKDVGAHAVLVLGRDDMKLFSHQIPAKKLSGEEAPGLPKDCWELDPASLTPRWLIGA